MDIGEESETLTGEFSSTDTIKEVKEFVERKTDLVNIKICNEHGKQPKSLLGDLWSGGVCKLFACNIKGGKRKKSL